MNDQEREKKFVNEGKVDVSETIYFVIFWRTTIDRFIWDKGHLLDKGVRVSKTLREKGLVG